MYALKDMKVYLCGNYHEEFQWMARTFHMLIGVLKITLSYRVMHLVGTCEIL